MATAQGAVVGGLDPLTLRLLGQVPLFSRLAAGELQALATLAHYRSVERAERVLAQGDHPLACYCVLSGFVKLVVQANTGEEKVVGLVGPGETFGEALLFCELASPVSAIAVEAGRLLAFPREPLIEALARSPGLALRMLGGLSRRLHLLVRELETQTVEPAGERVVRWLLSRVVGEGPTAKVRFEVSKATIASLLGVTPETLSRVLGHLSARGLIRVHGPEVEILDLPRLRSLRPCTLCMRRGRSED